MDGEEAEQQQRRVIGAVQVVEDEDERASVGRRAQQRRDGVEELKARGVGLARARVGGRCGDVARRRGHDVGHEAGQPRACLGPEGGDRRADVALGGQAAQDPKPRPVRRRAAAVPRTAPEHERTPGDSLCAERVGEGGLADAGVAGDHEEAAAPVQRAVETVTQLGELTLAADEVSPCV